MHQVITFVINPTWIKEMTGGSYCSRTIRNPRRVASPKLASVEPARLWNPAPPPPDRSHPVDWLGTSSTETTDP